MKKLLAATSNRHKVAEMKSMLQPHGIEILSANDVGGLNEVVEDADSFAGNAIKKAIEIAKFKNMTVLAEDSGLCVDALGGRPGIYSARYAGKDATDAQRLEKLLHELKDCTNRTASFVCVIALASPQGLIGTATGKCTGQISLQPHGIQGFAYDPVFIPNGYDKTFAELGESIKNNLSHRRHALDQALQNNLFQSV